MDTYKHIKIYTHEDFSEGTTLRQARQQLEGVETGPCVIVFGSSISGVNLGVGAHTRELGEIIAALLPSQQAA